MDWEIIVRLQSSGVPGFFIWFVLSVVDGLSTELQGDFLRSTSHIYTFTQHFHVKYIKQTQ